MSAAPMATAEMQGAATSADNPWPGLLAFRETDEGFFQGRHEEADELLRLVMRERLSVLFGLSGLGKSSLLQAGLFPSLRRQQQLPVYIRLDFSAAPLDLVAQVRDAIAREAAAHEIEAPPATEGETLWEYFHRAGHTFWNARNRPVTPVLVFDQFEEIFTLGRQDAVRSAAVVGLLEQLTDLAEGRPPAALKAWLDEHPDQAGAYDFGRHAYKLLLSLREDFLPELEALRSRMPALGLHRMRLRRMDGEAALMVVHQAPHLIDADVAEQVVRFVAADRHDRAFAGLEVEPALLSVVCRELNIKRGGRGESKITAALLEGSQEQVLTDFYERSMADLPSPVRNFVEDDLLTVSGYRDSAALENALSTTGVTREAIDRLVDRRLVRLEERGGVQRLELTHDLLTGVVKASRDGRKEREEAERARVAAARAEEEQRAARRAAEEELARQREKSERDRRDLRRVRVAAGVLLLLMVAAGGAAVWAFRAQGRAQEAARSAVLAQGRAEKAFVRMLNSPDGMLASSIFEQLSYEKGVGGAIDLVSDSSVKSNRWVAEFTAALAAATDISAPRRRPWADSVRQMLEVRLSKARGAPPSRQEDDKLNRRIRIAGGTFEMGSADGVGNVDERPHRNVTLSAFDVQEHEVTNEEYRRFDSTYARTEPEKYPVVHVTWFQAAAYAAWLGGSLPTEAQWEFAARGTEGRTYPWGEKAPDSGCDRANFDGCEKKGLKPVKQDRDAGKTPDHEVYDLAGNAAEWCQDWDGTYAAGSQKDPTGPSSGQSRVLRGGSFGYGALGLRGAFRYRRRPELGGGSIGFRVVWSVAGGL